VSWWLRRARERGERTWRFVKGEKVARGYSAKFIFMSPAMTDPAFASSAAVVIVRIFIVHSIAQLLKIKKNR
jgi:hypothetical protein